MDKDSFLLTSTLGVHIPCSAFPVCAYSAGKIINPPFPLRALVWMIHYMVTLLRVSILVPGTLVGLSKCGELP